VASGRKIVAICIDTRQHEFSVSRQGQSLIVPRILCALVLLATLSGCLARTAVDVVTLPVKAVDSGVDAVTTSQEEADRNRGRALRKQEERERREARRNAPDYEPRRD
jgi:hypothetical protein